MNREADLAARQNHSPDYGYGNRPAIEVIRLIPNLGGSGIDPHSSLDLDNSAVTAEEAPFTESQLEEKIAEVAENYQLIGDPKAKENDPKEFGYTILNEDQTDNGVLLVMSTQGSSLYDEEGNPNNEGNALELAYTALKYQEMGVAFVESPGTGGSTDFTEEEYKEASKDGKLAREVRDASGRIVDAEANETLQALARALDHHGINISLISANASGAHNASALAVELPEGLKGMFLYNSTNISDRHPLGLSIASLREIRTQRKYDEISRDPLKLTEDRREMARRVMGGERKSRFAQAKAQTHNPLKLWRQQRIFSRGNHNGQSAAVHAVAGQVKHLRAKITHVFPEFAAQYKSEKDLQEFVNLVNQLGGKAITVSDIESLKIPLGQYGHSHYPSARQTLEGYGFNR